MDNSIGISRVRISTGLLCLRWSFPVETALQQKATKLPTVREDLVKGFCREFHHNGAISKSTHPPLLLDILRKALLPVLKILNLFCGN